MCLSLWLVCFFFPVPPFPSSHVSWLSWCPWTLILVSVQPLHTHDCSFRFTDEQSEPTFWLLPRDENWCLHFTGQCYLLFHNDVSADEARVSQHFHSEGRKDEILPSPRGEFSGKLSFWFFNNVSVLQIVCLGLILHSLRGEFFRELKFI
jgi:hypothetical protein